MKLGLFAAGTVGLEVAELLRRRDARPSCLVLDERDRDGMNAKIRSAVDGGATAVLGHDDVDTADGHVRLRDLALDLGLLAWWPHILRSELLHIPRLGFLNLHPSFLPYGRGKDPNFWALVEGTPFGVSIHFVDERVDAGDVAFQREIPVSWDDTGESLYRKAQQALVELLTESLDQILSGDIPRNPHEPAPLHERRLLDAASEIVLDHNYTARQLLNVLRARTFSGQPGAWFRDGDDVFEARIEIERRNEESG